MTDAEIFRQNVLSFNTQLSRAAITTQNLDSLSGINPDSIIVVGMGGSGMPATILQNITGYVNIKKPIATWRDFGLPVTPFTRPLYIFVSFSGNTRETLSGFSQMPKGAHMAVVAGGGKLLEEAQANKLPYATFAQEALQPRQAWGLTLYGVLSLLEAAGLSTPAPDLSKTISPASLEAEGKKLAEKIKDTTPFIYTSNALSHIGQIFKIHCNESGKLLASANVFPEINHNELSAFETKPKAVSVMIPTTPEEHKRLSVEIDIVKVILEEYEIPVHIIQIPGADLMEVTANSIVLSQWVGYYLAMLRGLNPLGINTVNKIKELIRK